MKIIHADGFTHAELSSYRPTVLDNLLASMKYVLAGMGILRINLEHSRNKVREVPHILTVLHYKYVFRFTLKLFCWLKAVLT